LFSFYQPGCKKEDVRAIIHYLAASAILTIYGTQVCPFLDRLTTFELGSVVIFSLVILFIIRTVFLRFFLQQVSPFQRARFQFILELIIFGTAGLAMAFFNTYYYEFPLLSGMKLVLACLTLGVFAAADLGLEREFITALTYNDNKEVCLLVDKFFPLTHKFAYMGTVLIFFIGGILALVIIHDLDWVRSLGTQETFSSVVWPILTEIAFIFSVLLAYVTCLLLSHSRNLKVFFDRQTGVLQEVSSGSYEKHVPITTLDEFGVIAKYTNSMIENLKERTEELQNTQDVTIRALASLAETRDNETGQHIIRTQNYVKVLAQNLQNHPEYGPLLDDNIVDLLFKSAPLHDIGKVGIPDVILLKPGKLTDEEFDEMKKHTEYGSQALRMAEAELGTSSFLHMGNKIAHTHHEKWDGSGYPRGLKGTDIPLSGRLMALADVYDALISKRVYKEAFTHDKATAIIREGKGTHFDPIIVDAFDLCEFDFKRIAEKHADV